MSDLLEHSLVRSTCDIIQRGCKRIPYGATGTIVGIARDSNFKYYVEFTSPVHEVIRAARYELEEWGGLTRPTWFQHFFATMAFVLLVIALIMQCNPHLRWW